MERRHCFLSYGRKDDEPFVEELRDYLDREELSVWWDRTHMQARGMPFSRVLDEAIRGVDRLVFVVGPEALASSYVAQELRVAEETCKVVIQVLRSSDPKTVEATLQREHVYDVRGLTFSSVTAAQQRTLDALVAELKSPPTEPAGLRGVPGLPEYIDPRPEEVLRLVDLLLVETAGPVLLSAGMGGIGKSVLAGLVARSCRIRRAFAGVLFTRRAPDDTPISILNDLLRLASDLPSETGDLEDATRALKGLLGRSPHLLVVDNVWTRAQVEAVARAVDGTSARVLLTSRMQDIVEGLPHRRIEPKLLTPVESRAHLANWVRLTIERLPPEADTIVECCGGLMLALSLCGAFLSKNYNTWQELAQALSQFQLRELSLELQNYENPGVIAAMDVSLAALRKASPERAARYEALATFGTARLVPFEMVAALWQLSDDERAGARRDLRELHESSLLTLTPGDEHVLHDIQRAFLLSTGPDEATLRRRFLASFEAHGGLLEAARRHEWLRHVLVEYLVTSENWDELERLFASETETAGNAWFVLRLTHDELDQYLDDWNRISGACVRLEPTTQLRWLTNAALTHASLSNRAKNTPWPLVCAAARHQLWTTRRATAALRLMDPKDRAMGLATLVALHDDASLDRALAEFFESLSACDAREQANALEQLRRTLRPSDRTGVRPQAHGFVVARPNLSPVVLEQALGFLLPEDLPGLFDALDHSSERTAILTRLTTPEAARQRILAITADEDLLTKLELWQFACFDRELLRGDELRHLVSEVLRYAKPYLLELEHLMRLLNVASEANLRTTVPLLTGEAWGRLLGSRSAMYAKHLLKDLSSPSLIPGLSNFFQSDPSDDSAWLAARLARLAAIASGHLKVELLDKVVAGIDADLRHSAERSDFNGLSDLMDDFVKVWPELPLTTRSALLARIPSVDPRFRGEVISPLFAVEPATASQLARELLISLRYVQAWYEVQDPVTALAPQLPPSEIQLALALAEVGRDAGFEFSHAAILWNQLETSDRDRAHLWVLNRAEEHVHAPRRSAEWQVAGMLSSLSTEQPSWSPEVLEGARRLACRIQAAQYAAVTLAAVASRATGEEASEDWAAAEGHCENIQIDGARGEAFAKLAVLAAPGSRSERFCNEALRVEGLLADGLGARDSWPWRSSVIQELPPGPMTSERAIKLLTEVYPDKLDSYAPDLLPHCDVAALRGELKRFQSRDVGGATIRALVRRLTQGGDLEAAFSVARSHDYSPEALDEIASSLSLERTRNLLAKRPPRPALVERLAALGEFKEAIEAANQLQGIEHFKAVTRCCKHAAAPAIIQPLLDTLSDLEASDSLRGALAVAADVWPRLPESARLTACRVALDRIAKLPRQIAIPSLYLLSPVLVSFQPEAKPRAAASILDAILRVTRWWPVYPRAFADDVGSDGVAAH